MTLDELAAAILAAGRSRRMGRPKPLLPISGTTLIEFSLARFGSAGVRRVAIALGENADTIRAAARLDRAIVVRNTSVDRGPFSSLVLALDALRDEGGAVPGVFVLPVDVPCPPRDVLTLLAEAAEAPGTYAVVPLHRGHGGHPLLLTPRGSASVLHASGAVASLRLDVMVRSWGPAVQRIAVNDPSVVANINTPDDLRSLGKPGTVWSRSRGLH